MFLRVMLFSIAGLAAGCGSSFEGTYSGAGRENINVPMETAQVGGVYAVVVIAKSGAAHEVRRGPMCRLQATGEGETLSLGTWPSDGQACRFPVPDGRTFLPTVLTGSVTRTSAGISLRLQGSVVN